MRYSAFLYLAALFLILVACDSPPSPASTLEAFKKQRNTIPPLKAEDMKVLESLGFCTKGQITDTDIACNGDAFSVLPLTPNDDNRHDLFLVVTDNTAHCGSGGCSLFLCQEKDRYEITWEKQGVFIQQMERSDTEVFDLLIAEKVIDCDLDSEDWVDIGWAEVVYSYSPDRELFLPSKVVQIGGNDEEAACQKVLECLGAIQEF